MPETGTSLSLLSILVATIQDISFWTGFVTIVAFSQGRFNEKQIDHEELNPPLPARSFTSRFRYHSAASLYTGAYVLFYCLLVVVGSVPELQGVLKDLFGSFETIERSGATATGEALAPAPAGTEGDIELGTPAWAAMVLMVVAPTIPWMRRAELRFRLWLQEFSHIPFKARELADDILTSVAASRGAGERLENLDGQTLIQVFTDLQAVRRRLAGRGNTRRSERYRRFFLQNDELLRHTVDRFNRVAEELTIVRAALGQRRGGEAGEGNADDTPEAAVAVPPMTGELLVLARRYARLMACALLQIEAEEFYVRKSLRRMPGLKRVPLSDFRFTRSQVLLGVVVIVLLAEVVGAASSVIANTYILGADLSPEGLWNMIGYWLGWGIVAAIVFILPLTFAAAIYLYLMDRRPLQEEDDWPHAAATLMFGFLGCYGLALLPIVAVQAWRANQAGEVIGLLEAMLMALPPAFVCVLYIWRSAGNAGQGRTGNVVTDFLAFALAAGLPAVVAALVLVLRSMTAAGIEDFGDFSTYLVVLWAGPVITVTVVGGVFGALQCAVSRQTTVLWRERHQQEQDQLQQLQLT